MEIRSAIMLLICLLINPLIANCQSLDSVVTAIVAKAEKLRVEENNSAGAMQLMERALETLHDQKVENEIHLVPLYHKLGVNYYYQSEYTKAEPYATDALRIRLEKFGQTHLDVARSYFLRGAINLKLELYDLAESDIMEAIRSMENLLESNLSNDTLRLINMYDELIDLCSVTRNHTIALQYWDKSYQYYQKNPSVFSPNIADLHIAKGRIFTNQEEYDKAIAHLQIAIELYDELYKEDDFFGINLAGCYSSLAFIKAKQENYAQAIIDYSRALELLKLAVKPNGSFFVFQELGRVYNNLMELCGMSRDFPKANEYFDRSLSYNLQGWESSSNPEYALLHRDRAKIALDRQNLTEALSFNTESLQALLPDFESHGPTDLVSLSEQVISNKISFVQTLSQRAEILRALAKEESNSHAFLMTAFGHYQTIDAVITQMGQRYRASGSKYELIEASYPIYEQAIATAIAVYESTTDASYIEAAYQFAARNKALVLLQERRGDQALKITTIPDELKEKEQYLKRQIFQLEADLYADRSNLSTEAYEQAKDKLFDLQREYQKLIDHLEEAFPDYFDHKYGFEQSLTINNIQQQLDKEEALLEYFIGEKNLYVFHATKQQFGYEKIALPDAFEHTLASVLTTLHAPELDLRQFADEAHQLYQWLLLAEVEGKLDPAISSLIIIPDGQLLQLPFGVLVKSPLASVDDPSLDYLLAQYNITYAYSSQLLQTRQVELTPPYVFGGFGLEYDEYTLAALNGVVGDPVAGIPLTRDLGKLHYSDDEVQGIAALLGGDEWLNESATLKAFQKHAQDYAILHLATHGILDENYPLNSSLVFTKESDTTAFLLRAADLYNMQLRADMVVLSACNTGSGTLEKGEGIRSLARAFAYAGCPSTVASLWSASDKSTKDVLLSFYTYLQEGMKKGEALRRAKLDYLKSAPPAYAAPFYWAHLTAIGDPEALVVLSNAKDYTWLWWGLLLLLGFTGLFIWRKK